MAAIQSSARTGVPRGWNAAAAWLRRRVLSGNRYTLPRRCAVRDRIRDYLRAHGITAHRCGCRDSQGQSGTTWYGCARWESFGRRRRGCGTTRSFRPGQVSTWDGVAAWRDSILNAPPSDARQLRAASAPCAVRLEGIQPASNRAIRVDTMTRKNARGQQHHAEALGLTDRGRHESGSAGHVTPDSGFSAARAKGTVQNNFPWLRSILGQLSVAGCMSAGHPVGDTGSAGMPAGFPAAAAVDGAQQSVAWGRIS